MTSTTKPPIGTRIESTRVPSDESSLGGAWTGAGSGAGREPEVVPHRRHGDGGGGQDAGHVDVGAGLDRAFGPRVEAYDVPADQDADRPEPVGGDPGEDGAVASQGVVSGRRTVTAAVTDKPGEPRGEP